MKSIKLAQRDGISFVVVSEDILQLVGSPCLDAHVAFRSPPVCVPYRVKYDVSYAVESDFGRASHEIRDTRRSNEVPELLPIGLCLNPASIRTEGKGGLGSLVDLDRCQNASIVAEIGGKTVELVLELTICVK
jgi:hypothetical protein